MLLAVDGHEVLGKDFDLALLTLKSKLSSTGCDLTFRTIEEKLRLIRCMTIRADSAFRRQRRASDSGPRSPLRLPPSVSSVGDTPSSTPVTSPRPRKMIINQGGNVPFVFVNGWLNVCCLMLMYIHISIYVHICMHIRACPFRIVSTLRTLITYYDITYHMGVKKRQNNVT